MIQRVRAEQIRPLRLQVLRPGREPEAVVWPDDDELMHFGAYDEGGGLVGCVSVDPESWQLRGMATVPAVRGQGYGGQLLLAAQDAAREAGAAALWCNARSTAIGFYAHYGWVVTSEEFIQQETGLPHVRMRRELA